MIGIASAEAVRRTFSVADADLLERIAIEESRNDFWAYRQYMNPNMKLGWFQRQVAGELQKLFDDLVARKRPILVIEAPPQHGKSYIIIDFISWIAGKRPDLKTLFTSFSRRLGIRANLRLQRLLDSEKYGKIFPDTFLIRKDARKGRYLRNSEVLEYVGMTGGFRNTTTGGSITGEGLDLGIIDDPLKGREKANKEEHRNKIWDWFTDDFFTRFADHAGLLGIWTRWHVDDPGGRLLKERPNIKVLKYPALAEEGIPLMPQDPRVPGSGEALFPEHKSRDFLLIRKAFMALASWLSIYQQMPIVLGGDIIKGAWFPRYKILPELEYRIITADTAQKTKERNDPSVFECWGKGGQKIYLTDVLKNKWEAPALRRNAINFWEKHQAITDQGPLRKMLVEDKSSGTGLIQDIKNGTDGAQGIPVKGVERNIDKLTRVMDVLSYIEAGYVVLPENAPWVSDFIAECEAFTADDSHEHDDQIDAMCDAIVDMLMSRRKGFFDV